MRSPIPDRACPLARHGGVRIMADLTSPQSEVSPGATCHRARPAAPSLRQRVLVGTVWVTGGMLTRYAMRMVSSLVLTRILFPEAFGLAATVGLVVAAIEMCSDLGIRQALTQHPEGGTRTYLNTAWTLAIVRSLGVCAVIILCAKPAAAFFQEPALFSIIIVSSVGVVVTGFTHPDILLWSRNLQQNRITTWEVLSDLVRIVATIAASLWLRNVWGLVLGGLLGSFARTAMSHAMSGSSPQWLWDLGARRSIVRFGRFVLLSSIIGFLASRLDVAFVSKYLGMERAGIYYVAVVLASFADAILAQVWSHLLFPALSRAQGQGDLLRSRTTESFLLMAVFVLPVCVLIAMNAELIVTTLYDPRYADAAIAMKWLILATSCTAIGNCLNCPLMATGVPQYGTIATLSRLVAFAAGAFYLGSRCGIAGYSAATAIGAGAFCGVICIAGVYRGHFVVEKAVRALGYPICLWFALMLVRAAIDRWMSDRVPGLCVYLAVSVVLVAVCWFYKRRLFFDALRGR